VDQIPYWLRLFLPWRLHYSVTSCTTPCEIEILAPKKVHTRRNPDPEAAIPVSDPEKLVRRRKERPVTPVLHPDRYLSFPRDGLTSIEDLVFDVKFEQSLFRTKSESCLNETIFDEKRFQDLVLAASVKPVVTPAQNQHPL
jgi:hypothetical protein